MILFYTAAALFAAFIGFPLIAIAGVILKEHFERRVTVTDYAPHEEWWSEREIELADLDVLTGRNICEQEKLDI